MIELTSSLVEASAGDLKHFSDEGSLSSYLSLQWKLNGPRDRDWDLAVHCEALSFSELESEAEPSPPPPRLAWVVAFTPTFTSSVCKVDRKLQGRVLSAITELASAPIRVQGDTIKPLGRELKGLWRYRLGDYRLVYQPRQSEQTIVLLDIAARGAVYD